jgi:hypothetical protein
MPFTLSNTEAPHRVAMPRHRNLAWVLQKLCPGESGVFAEQIAQMIGATSYEASDFADSGLDRFRRS